MEPPPPPEQVLQALQSLYSAADREERKAANLFLVRLSERAASLPWDLIWSLLGASAAEAQFCGAQLLLEKMQRTWDSLAVADRRAVGEFLLQEVLHGYGHHFACDFKSHELHRQRTSLVSRRLCRSLSMFCLYDQPDGVLGVFDAITASLAQRLTTGEPIALLIDFLYSLPMLSHTQEVTPERRRKASAFVGQKSLIAINALLVVLRAAAAANRDDQGAVVLQALTSWFSEEAAGAYIWSAFSNEPTSPITEALQWLSRPAILAKEVRR